VEAVYTPDSIRAPKIRNIKLRSGIIKNKPEANKGAKIYAIGPVLRYTPINSSFSLLICLKK
jgi:hypothetical protein